MEDKDGNIWFNIGKSLIVFDGEEWEEISNESYYILDDNLFPLALDSLGNIWFASEKNGIYTYNGTDYKNYNCYNSGLPDDWVTSIAIDKYGNKWIGTIYNGLAVFREGGVILSAEDERPTVYTKIKFLCFPNPASDNINFQLNNNESGNITLKLFDIFGREIRTIYDGYSDGNFNLNHHIENISSGMYFVVLSTATEKKAVRIVVSN